MTGDGLGEGVGEGEGLGDGDGLGDALGERLGEGEGLGEGDALGCTLGATNGVATAPEPKLRVASPPCAGIIPVLFVSVPLPHPVRATQSRTADAATETPLREVRDEEKTRME